MSTGDHPPLLEAALAPFRRVAPFLADYLGARALHEAIRRGLVSRLEDDAPAAEAALAGTLGIPVEGMRLLLMLLRRAGVVEADGSGGHRLTPAFRAALPDLPLMEAKLGFSQLLLPDFHEHLSALLDGKDAFMAASRLFGIFRYDLATREGTEAEAATADWMRWTTALSRHEAPVLLALHDFRAARSLLDVGGNSGEVASQACARHPGMHAVVADLPAVCRIGRRHVAEGAQAARIAFHPLDLRREELPRGFDVVLLKSVLHDWPDQLAAALLDKAARALAPGGRLLVFERTPLAEPTGYAAIPDLLFHPFYRHKDAYLRHLAAAGLMVEQALEVRLDTEFMFLCAQA